MLKTVHNSHQKMLPTDKKILRFSSANNFQMPAELMTTILGQYPPTNICHTVSRLNADSQASRLFK